MNFLRNNLSILKSLFTGGFLIRIFVMYLIISQVYYSYRYIFGYGSRFTSPHAQETPFEFKIAKYLITLVTVIAAFLFVTTHIKAYLPLALTKFKNSPIYFTLLLVASLYFFVTLMKFDISHLNFGSTELIKWLSVVPISLITSFLIIRKSFITLMFKLTALSWFYQLLGFLIVFLGTVIFEKPPAQSYPGAFTRFGGLWDDPNATAFFMLIPLFAFLSLKSSIQEKYKLFIYSASVVSAAIIFLSLSVSSAISLVFGLGLIFVIRRNIFILKNIAIVFFVVVALALVSPYSNNYVNAKIGSLQARVCSTFSAGSPEECKKYLISFGLPSELNFGYLPEEVASDSDGTPLSTIYSDDENLNRLVTFLIGTKAAATFNENFYIMIFFNYGITGLILLLAVMGLAFFKSLKMAFKLPANHMLKQFGVFSSAVILAAGVGMMGLPFMSMYPISLYIWLVLTLVFFIPIPNKISLK